MSQQFDPNISNEELRIRRMLAYKSLILSILQRCIVFLVIIAVIVAAIVLYFLYKREQQDPHRWKASANLVYNDMQSMREKGNSVPITLVAQIVSPRDVKLLAADAAGIPEDKKNLLDKGLEIFYDRRNPNVLTLKVGWDDKEQAVDLVNAYAAQVINSYTSYRTNSLRGKKEELKKREDANHRDIQDIDKKLRQLTANLTASTPEQELERLKRQLYTLQDTLADLKKQKTNEELKVEQMEESLKKVNLQALHAYDYIMSVIKERNQKFEAKENMLQRFTEHMNETQKAIKEYERAQKKVNKVLKDFRLDSEEDFLLLNNVVSTEKDLKDSQLRLVSLKQYLSSTQKDVEEVLAEIHKVEEYVPVETNLKDSRKKCEDNIKIISAAINEIDSLLSIANQELRILNEAATAGNANGLKSKQYIVAIFVGGLCSAMLAVIIIMIGAQFGCISTAAELHDLAEIEVFSLSESKLKKLDEAHLQEFAHNIFYVLNQLTEERRYLFFGALRGSYSTDIFFEQLLLQFAMNGTRIFLLNLEPYDMATDEADNTAGNEDAEDPVAAELLGVEKKGDVGVFKLGNPNFLSPNERDILNMDIDTLLSQYDKIIFQRKAPFTGKELLLKQAISLTKCCLFSIGKKRSPRSFLKFLRDSQEDQENIITGLFTEP